jgi:benzoyl-CoA reductase/2-hydroxyglutaryl-CoA dehydratase subunit BcrC/BadD/HgdB
VVDYYNGLIEEMRQRAADKIGSIPNEKYRLLWDNLPVWYKTKWLSDKFASHGACLVADTYTSAWCKQLDYIDKNDFVKSMVDCYTLIYLNIGVDQMVDTVKGMVEKYDVDGIVMHSNRSCKPYSLGQYDIQRMIQKATGVPSVMIEADMVDERNFSESQIDTRIDAFMELIKQKKG